MSQDKIIAGGNKNMLETNLVNQFYDFYNEQDRLETRHGQIEFMTNHFSICEREDLLGASNHTLDILRKV